MIKEEDGKIIINELRPMSEAPLFDSDAGEFVEILAFYEPTGSFYRIRALPDVDICTTWIGGYSDLMRNRHFLGWIPMPTYQPKEK